MKMTQLVRKFNAMHFLFGQYPSFKQPSIIPGSLLGINLRVQDRGQQNL